MKNNYQITSETLAIISMGISKAHILEKNDEFFVNKSAYDIINENCIRYGSSYDGRKAGTKYLTGSCYKCPIIVEENTNTIVFPTKSPKNIGCIWINLENLDRIERNNELVKLNFCNGSFMNIKASYYSIENQYLRAALLQSVSRGFKNNKNTL